MNIYPVIFTQTNDKEDTYLVYIPDLDGATEGKGLNDAFLMAKDYIGNALYLKSNDEIPAASLIESVDVSQSEFAECGKSFVSLVDVNLDEFRMARKTKTVRRNITLPEWLDDMAAKAKINVSSVTQAALKEKLNITI